MVFLSISSQTPEGDAQMLTEVDLFISTQRIKVLNADSQVNPHLHADHQTERVGIIRTLFLSTALLSNSGRLAVKLDLRYICIIRENNTNSNIPLLFFFHNHDYF